VSTVGARDVLEVLDALAASGLPYRLDGGWGVDALVGRQTRSHDDLDLVVSRDDVHRVLDALRGLRFRHDPSVVPGLPARVVLRDPAGRQVDLHPVVFDVHGNGRQDLGGGASGHYPAEGLAGVGSVGGRPVACVTAELQLRHRCGYEHDEGDRHDVRLLAELIGSGGSPAQLEQEDERGHEANNREREEEALKDPVVGILSLVEGQADELDDAESADENDARQGPPAQENPAEQE
jgi:lincosamide nucleotidyltransferase A/C/D/E